MIAEEVEGSLKEEGVENYGMLTITDEGEYQLRYNDLIAPMIKAIQELNGKNEKLVADNEELKNKNDEMKQRLLKLEQQQNMLINEIENIKSKNTEVKEVKFSEK